MNALSQSIQTATAWVITILIYLGIAAMPSKALGNLVWTVVLIALLPAFVVLGMLL